MCSPAVARPILRASDLQKLPEDVVHLYDDGSATTDQVLYFGDRLAGHDAPNHALSS
jgi:hypothetical protein